jgi:hypothetical protein
LFDPAVSEDRGSCSGSEEQDGGGMHRFACDRTWLIAFKGGAVKRSATSPTVMKKSVVLRKKVSN